MISKLAEMAQNISAFSRKNRQNAEKITLTTPLRFEYCHK